MVLKKMPENDVLKSVFILWKKKEKTKSSAFFSAAIFSIPGNFNKMLEHV
jgi:hypothetical protein